MKALFYGNEWEDFKRFVEVFARLEQEGFEVAVSTSNRSLIPLLSVGKLLVVNPKTYYYTFYVYPDGKKPSLEGKGLPFSELLEMMR